MNEIKAIVKQLKEDGQDFEFYPTTIEMIRAVFFHSKQLGSIGSILDIGAGNGGFLTQFKALSDNCLNLYAIEKSPILLNAMPKDIFIIGTDFHRQTLIDKKMDIIFCNPPYSEFENWAENIIKQANAKYVYMVLPKRWREVTAIEKAIKIRQAKTKVIYTGTFRNSEFREARADIDIIFLDLSNRSTNPFDIWFDNTFKFNTQEENKSHWEDEKDKKSELKNAIVSGRNIIENLEELYIAELNKILNNYRVLETLDADIFKELDVDISSLRAGLKIKVEGLKNLYWEELFNNLDKITDRLTSKSRLDILETLRKNTAIDFTAENAYAVVIWIIKNANEYLDKQLKEVYLEMSDPENVMAYKSNRHFTKDDWRFNKEEKSHYMLDYRLVFKRWGLFPEYDYLCKNGMGESGHKLINDIVTIAKNLGFNVLDNSYNFQWKAGKTCYFDHFNEKTQVAERFMEIRPYKNNNIHAKISIDFMRALNIEAARILKWVNCAEEASREMNIPISEVQKYYHKNENIKLATNSIKLLTGSI